jgi:parallel beta-helix repeat protein
MKKLLLVLEGKKEKERRVDKKMKKLLLILASLALATGTAYAGDVTVDDDLVECPTADYTDIQSATGDAGLGAGDSILVYPGTYNVTANTNIIGVPTGVTLKAATATKPVIVGDGTMHHIVRLLGNGSAAEGLELQAKKMGGEVTCIKVYNSNCIVKDCLIDGDPDGDANGAQIGVWGAGGNHTNIQVLDNEIKNITRTHGTAVLFQRKQAIIQGNTIDNCRRRGIYIDNANGNIIGGALAGQGNTITNIGPHGASCGIEVRKADSIIQNNTITNVNRDGIFSFQQNLTAIGNTIDNCVRYGILVVRAGVKTINIQNNTISNCVTHGQAAAIHLGLQDGAIVCSGNTITNCRRGIMNPGTGAIIQSNTITGITFGFAIWLNQRGNIIIMGNTIMSCASSYIRLQGNCDNVIVTLNTVDIPLTDPLFVHADAACDNLQVFGNIYIPPPPKDYYVNAATGNDTTGDGSAAKPYKTIQKAAGIAKAPDKIIVAPGTYSVTSGATVIKVPAGVTLKKGIPGAPLPQQVRPVIQGNGNVGWIVQLEGGGTVMEGFKVEAKTLGGEHSCVRPTADDNTIIDCVIGGPSAKYGLNLNGKLAVVKNTTIEDVKWHTGQLSVAIASPGVGSIIQDCTISDCHNGISNVYDAVTITGCNVAVDPRYGIGDIHGDDVEISDCVVTNPGTAVTYGIRMSWGGAPAHRLTIKDCTVTSGKVGIAIERGYTNDVTIENCTVTAGTTGYTALTLCQLGANCIVKNNQLSGDNGLNICSFNKVGNPVNMQITGNTIVGETRAALVIVTTDTTNLLIDGNNIELNGQGIALKFHFGGRHTGLKINNNTIDSAGFRGISNEYSGSQPLIFINTEINDNDITCAASGDIYGAGYNGCIAFLKQQSINFMDICRNKMKTVVNPNLPYPNEPDPNKWYWHYVYGNAIEIPSPGAMNLRILDNDIHMSGVPYERAGITCEDCPGVVVDGNTLIGMNGCHRPNYNWWVGSIVMRYGCSGATITNNYLEGDWDCADGSGDYDYKSCVGLYDIRNNRIVLVGSRWGTTAVKTPLVNCLVSGNAIAGGGNSHVQLSTPMVSARYVQAVVIDQNELDVPKNQYGIHLGMAAGNCIVRNNEIIGKEYTEQVPLPDGMTIDQSAIDQGGVMPGWPNVLLEGNLVAVDGEAIHVTGLGNQYRPTTVKVYNNTIDGASVALKAADRNGVGGISPPPGLVKFDVENNIVSNCGELLDETGCVKFPNPFATLVGVTADHNCLFNCGTIPAVLTGDGDVYEDPCYKEPHLKVFGEWDICGEVVVVEKMIEQAIAMSPCTDAGKLTGTGRPFAGSAPDMGCFEFAPRMASEITRTNVTPETLQTKSEGNPVKAHIWFVDGQPQPASLSSPCPGARWDLDDDGVWDAVGQTIQAEIPECIHKVRTECALGVNAAYMCVQLITLADYAGTPDALGLYIEDELVDGGIGVLSSDPGKITFTFDRPTVIDFLVNYTQKQLVPYDDLEVVVIPTGTTLEGKDTIDVIFERGKSEF